MKITPVWNLWKLVKKTVALAVLGVIAGIQMPMKLIKMTNKDVEIDLLATESQGIQWLLTSNKLDINYELKISLRGPYGVIPLTSNWLFQETKFI